MTDRVTEAFSSLEELLEPGVLGRLLGRDVRTVERSPFEPAGWSSTDARFESVRLDDEPEPSLIAKTVRRRADWVAVATDDTVDREVRLWETDLLGRLPRPAAHAIVGASRTDTGYSVLMRDVATWLLPGIDDQLIPKPVQYLVLDALAAMHAEYWMDETLLDPALGLSSLARFVNHTAPSTVEKLRVKGSGREILRIIEDGWRRLPEVSDPSFAADVQWLAEEPALIVETASALPWTLVHADPRTANLAVDSRHDIVYLLDWGRPAPTLPALDLAYWLQSGSAHRVSPHDVVIDAYATRLRSRLGQRFSDDWWEPQLRLGLLAVFTTMAPFIASSRTDEMPWWIERVRPQLLALG